MRSNAMEVSLSCILPIGDVQYDLKGQGYYNSRLTWCEYI